MRIVFNTQKMSEDNRQRWKEPGIFLLKKERKLWVYYRRTTFTLDDLIEKKKLVFLFGVPKKQS